MCLEITLLKLLSRLPGINGFTFLVQSGAVIMQSNVTPYCIKHCSNWCRMWIRLRDHFVNVPSQWETTLHCNIGWAHSQNDLQDFELLKDTPHPIACPWGPIARILEKNDCIITAEHCLSNSPSSSAPTITDPSPSSSSSSSSSSLKTNRKYLLIVLARANWQKVIFTSE